MKRTEFFLSPLDRKETGRKLPFGRTDCNCLFRDGCLFKHLHIVPLLLVIKYNQMPSCIAIFTNVTIRQSQGKCVISWNSVNIRNCNNTFQGRRLSPKAFTVRETVETGLHYSILALRQSTTAL